MWSFFRTTWSRQESSEGSDSSSFSGSSYEDTLDQLHEDIEVDSSSKGAAIADGFSKLSVYPPLSSIDSGTLSMERVCSVGAAQIYQGGSCEGSSPLKRFKTSTPSRTTAPPGGFSHTGVSTPFAPPFDSTDTSSSKYVNGPTYSLSKCSARADSASEFRPQVVSPGGIGQQLPGQTAFNRCSNSDVKSEGSSSSSCKNLSPNFGYAAAPVSPATPVCHSTSFRFTGKAPPSSAAEFENLTQSIPFESFDYPLLLSDWNASAAQRDDNACSPDFPAARAENNAGPFAANGESICNGDKQSVAGVNSSSSSHVPPNTFSSAGGANSATPQLLWEWSVQQQRSRTPCREDRNPVSPGFAPARAETSTRGSADNGGENFCRGGRQLFGVSSNASNHVPQVVNNGGALKHDSALGYNHYQVNNFPGNRLSNPINVRSPGPAVSPAKAERYRCGSGADQGTFSTRDRQVCSEFSFKPSGHLPPETTRSGAVSPTGDLVCKSYEWDTFRENPGSNPNGVSVRNESVPSFCGPAKVCASGPENRVKLGKQHASPGKGQLQDIKEPWRCLEELIDESCQDEPIAESCDDEFTQAWPPVGEHWSCLGTLDFVSQVFPILTRLRGKRLEEVFSLEDLKYIGTLTNGHTIKHLNEQGRSRGWSASGLPVESCDEPVTNNYVCRIRPTGEYIFELLPEKKQASSLLQRALGHDKVLKVKFDEDYAEDGRKGPRPDFDPKKCKRLLKKGIVVGLRRYQYFAHKASDKDEKKAEGTVKCFLVCTESLAKADKDSQFQGYKSVAEARCKFMHIHKTESIPKYIARMQLVLSRTITINLNWSEIHVLDMPDIMCKDASSKEERECTDGTGFISVDLAKLIPTNITQGRQSKEADGSEEYPALIQVRLFYKGIARKGTLLANNLLPKNTIVCYKSMQKVKLDEKLASPSFNSLEVVNTSRKPRWVETAYTAKMSRDSIMLLSACGVPDSFFIKLAENAIEKNYSIMKKVDVAVSELVEKDPGKAAIPLLMIAAGIPLDEPYLQRTLFDFTKGKREDLSSGRFDLPDSFFLMGTADPTGTLKRNQVAITLSEGFLCCRKLLVYRFPGRHPGDIHVFESVHNSRLEAVVGNGKYIIIFPTMGFPPITEEIGKGDLDGDTYWVCKNTELVNLFTENAQRWQNPLKPSTSVRKPEAMAPDELEDSLISEFIQARFFNQARVGRITNMWYDQMDQYLHSAKRKHLDAALKLVPLTYDALDASKHGYHVKMLDTPLPPTKLPHWRQTEFTSRETYHSKSIMGQIFDLAKDKEGEARKIYETITSDPAFKVENFLKHVEMWNKLFKEYKYEMTMTLTNSRSGSNDVSTNTDALFMKYRKKLYGGATSFTECKKLGTKEQKTVLEEASAIYSVVYSTYNRDVSAEPKLTFAWNVAVEALCEIYMSNTSGNEPVLTWVTPEKYMEIQRRYRKKSARKLVYE
ncbi:hypothetical protein R1sor_013394 [Riccia sorocarpa]|uniref:RNA-dependent RNA polymerase n=1 Tax=Riccia sorocarpa TaxID=122646 RepID=A0ABD3H9P4_9MARC